MNVGFQGRSRSCWQVPRHPTGGSLPRMGSGRGLRPSAGPALDRPSAFPFRGISSTAIHCAETIWGLALEISMFSTMGYVCLSQHLCKMILGRMWMGFFYFNTCLMYIRKMWFFFSTYDRYVKFVLRTDLFKQASHLKKTHCVIVQVMWGTRVTHALLSVGSLLPVTQAQLSFCPSGWGGCVRRLRQWDTSGRVLCRSQRLGRAVAEAPHCRAAASCTATQRSKCLSCLSLCTPGCLVSWPTLHPDEGI